MSFVDAGSLPSSFPIFFVSNLFSSPGGGFSGTRGKGAARQAVLARRQAQRAVPRTQRFAEGPIIPDVTVPTRPEFDSRPDFNPIIPSAVLPPIVVTDPTGAQITIDVAEPISRGATIEAVQKTAVSDPLFSQVLEAEHGKARRTITNPGDFPLSGPTRAPFGDKPPEVEISQNNQESGGIMSFLGDALNFITGGLNRITGTRTPNFAGPSVAPTPMGFGPGFLPAAGRAAGRILRDPRVQGTIGGVVGSEIIDRAQSRSGGTSEMSQILAQARAASPGATKRKIIAAARHCGMENAAAMFGISTTDVCKVVVAGAGRRSRGITAADLRRTNSTIRKLHTVKSNLKKAGCARL